MLKYIKNIITLGFLFSLLFFVWIHFQLFSFYNKKNVLVYNKENKKIQKQEIKKDRILKIEIGEGDTYGSLMKDNGIDYSLAMEIYNVASSTYDLIKIRQGKIIELIFDEDSDHLKTLIYRIDSEDELKVSLDKEKKWKVELYPIAYEIKIKTKGGVIESSMYQTALDNNIDTRAIIELANAFQWTIDFAMDPRKGDEFKFVYEERYLDGKYINPGKILGAYYVNAGEKYEIYYFEEDENNKGYFDQDGNSVQKMFLKAPVAFKYISSGFTTGKRYVSAFKSFTRSHMAIDYAAALGTPIRAVGDGTVTRVRYGNTGYGNLLSIRHNGTYSTNYAHLSKFAVKYGQKVKQGDIIGYVGSTGYSTGPHLHFEMVKNGVKINPLKEVLPPGKAIKEENKDRFFKEIEKIKKLLE